MSDDVYMKLAEASSPEDVKRILGECGCKLVDAAPGEGEGEDEGPEVEIEVSTEAPPEKKKPGPPKGFRSKLMDAVSSSMGAEHGEG